MALIIRRHWLSMILSIAIVATLAAGFWIQRVSPARAQTSGDVAAPPEAATPQNKGTDPQLYSRVQALRQELCLTSTDLAAMGCTKETAALVLQRLVEWQKSNQAALDQADEARLQADRAYRETMTKIHVGPRNEALIAQAPLLEQAVTLADQQRERIVQSAIPQLSAAMDGAQIQVWNNARANQSMGMPSDYRYVAGMTQQQVKELNLALRKRRPNQTTSKADTLMAAQRGGVQAAAATTAGHIDAVMEAEISVLPPPQPPEEHPAPASPDK